jgi:superfamily I DNA/RNA helicase
MSERIWSPQQLAVFNWVENGHGSAFVEAVAGAGKTTTLIEACSRMSGQVAFVAFNKKIADEITAKIHAAGLSQKVYTGTFHKFGLAAWRRQYPQVKAGPEAAKEKSRIVAERLRTPANLISIVDNLVGQAKQRGIGTTGMSPGFGQHWLDIIDHFGIEYDLPASLTVADLIKRSTDALLLHIELAPQYCDFNDMLYMPTVSGLRMFEHDWVLTDEAQDTNPIRRILARKMLRRDGRAMFVGDRNQAIYGFNGADAAAVDRIIKDFKCTQLPLTVTYRCPKRVVEAAQTVVSHIEAHESAPEGSVSTITEAQLYQTEFKIGEDVILCRNTRPLVAAAYILIAKGLPAHVEGRDIGKGLLKFISRFKCSACSDLLLRMEHFVQTEREKLKSVGKDMAAAALVDRAGTISVLAEGLDEVEQLRARIEHIFKDSEEVGASRLSLSTIHKAKGREWNRVFLLGQNRYMPSIFARQEWELEQENNLIYVAYTRAKSELVLVDVAE